MLTERTVLEIHLTQFGTFLNQIVLNFVDGTNSPGNSFNTIWFKKVPKVEERLSLLSGQSTIKTNKTKSNQYIFETNTKTISQFRVNTAYFPGWQVYIDGRKQKTEITKEGLFSFKLMLGKHLVEVRFADTIYP